MDVQQPTSSNATSMMQGILRFPLESGEMGVLLARAGVGKTACLTHIALEQLLRGQPVLHVCIDEMPEKIKVWYAEFMKNLTASQPRDALAKLQSRIEPLRFILAYLHHTFNPGKLEQSLLNLKDQAKFNPSMVVLDGLDFDRVSRSTIEALQDFARRNGVSIWMSARTHRHISVTNERGIPYPCHEIDDVFHTIVLLEPVTNAVQVKVLKNGEQYKPVHPELVLNSQTYLSP
jgi:hypothetical protein